MPIENHLVGFIEGEQTAFCYESGSWWFRIFGWGIHFHDHRKYPPLFSERNHLDGKRRLKIGPLCWSIVKPSTFWVEPLQPVREFARPLRTFDYPLGQIPWRPR